MPPPIRALLVEDDDVDAQLLCDVAADQPAMETIRIERVDRLGDALERLRTIEVDVVLLDLGLPDSDGPGTFDSFRARAPHLPVIVLTGNDDDRVALAALEAGAQDYLVKRDLPHLPLPRLLRYAMERYRLQSSLEASEARFRTLVELADDALYRYSILPAPRLDYISPAIEPLTGFSPAELYADTKLWGSRVHPDDRSSWADHARLCAGAPDRLVYRWRRPDGTWVWLEDRRTPVFEGSTLVAMQGITRDVSARERTEEALRQALRQERQAVEKLRKLDELKTTFLQAVSHELRTPLTVIRGFAMVLQQQDDVLPPSQRKHMLERLASATARLERLLVDLMDVDRLNRGLAQADRRPTDVGELIRAVLVELETPNHSVSLECRGNARADLDAPKVERIIENLLYNAVKHTPPGTTVRVVVDGAEAGNGMVITVADDGPGIPADVVERIFEPFVQGSHAGRDASPGTGIGLTLVARFAELHGGRAWIEPTPGGGATFKVTLPTAANPSVAPGTHREPAGSSTGPLTREAQDASVAHALRGLLRATTVEEVSEILVETVERLGGTIVGRDVDVADALGFDLSLGTGPPLLPAAASGTVARAALDTHIPRLVEDAWDAADRCRRLGDEAAVRAVRQLQRRVVSGSPGVLTGAT